MNTTCKRGGEDDGSSGDACGKPTLRGRTHCEEHRAAELRLLDNIRVNAKRVCERADQDYFAYLSEGYDP